MVFKKTNLFCKKNLILQLTTLIVLHFFLSLQVCFLIQCQWQRMMTLWIHRKKRYINTGNSWLLKFDHWKFLITRSESYRVLIFFPYILSKFIIGFIITSSKTNFKPVSQPRKIWTLKNWSSWSLKVFLGPMDFQPSRVTCRLIFTLYIVCIFEEDNMI